MWFISVYIFVLNRYVKWLLRLSLSFYSSILAKNEVLLLLVVLTDASLFTEYDEANIKHLGAGLLLILG